MVDHERGAYTPPTDGTLSFDPRQPVRGARPAPITLILSIVVLAAVVAAIFFFYRSGVRQAGQAPQIVGAPVTGMTAPAPNEAQPQDPAAGLQIYRSEAGAPVETVPPPPKFVPAPEEPAMRTAPAPSVVVTPPAAPAPQPSQPAIRPALPAEAPPIKAAAPPAPKPAAAAPAPKPAPPPVVKAEAKPAPAEKPVAGVAVVQIGAVSSTALADKTWKDAIAAAGGLGSGKGKSVQKVEKDGATLYRTAVTGFASRDAAQAFCAKLKAGGKNCFVR